MSKLSRSIVALVAVSASFVGNVSAQSPRDWLPDSATPQTDFIAWVHDALNLAIGMAGLVAVGYLIYSGIQYIMANGDENKIDKATKGITYAVVGLIVCFISVLIVTFVIDRVIQG